jgi:hypothetical protein
MQEGSTQVNPVQEQPRLPGAGQSAPGANAGGPS